MYSRFNFHLVILISSLFLLIHPGIRATEKQNYTIYHHQITRAEKLITEERFNEALQVYETVIRSYEFIFLRDYQVACQLALMKGKVKESFGWMREGMKAGWKMKSIRKSNFLKKLKEYPEWKNIRDQYDSLHGIYLKRIDHHVRNEVNTMFRKDQRKALAALFKLSDKAQIRYGEKRFAPHSEQQFGKLIEIMNNMGYPGERMIGNEMWMNVILSHHNSISEQYNQEDTLYTYLKPRLQEALKTGYMSPYSYAIIEDWYLSVKSGHQESSYGYVGEIHNSDELINADRLRKELGIRSIEIRNRLIEIGKKTGMDFDLTGGLYLSDEKKLMD
jgi:hypothetical protein